MALVLRRGRVINALPKATPECPLRRTLLYSGPAEAEGASALPASRPDRKKTTRKGHSRLPLQNFLKDVPPFWHLDAKGAWQWTTNISCAGQSRATRPPSVL